VSDAWTLTERAAEDGLFVVRARAALPAADERARHPVAIWISWPFGELANAAAETAVLAEMIAFEEALHAAAEQGGWGMLVAVVTGGAAREWLFQAADGQAFVGELRAALEGHPVYPFELRAWDDPSWKAARELAPRAGAH
jgi:hypothetical protein